MAKYRQIQTSYWNDGFVLDLLPEEKLFYIYIMSNPKSSQCGIYELPKQIISMETGYDRKTVDKLLITFEKYGKISYCNETKEVLILNWAKYNPPNNTNVIKCINKELNEVKNTPFIEEYYKAIVKLKIETREIFEGIELTFLNNTEAESRNEHEDTEKTEMINTQENNKKVEMINTEENKKACEMIDKLENNKGNENNNYNDENRDNKNIDEESIDENETRKTNIDDWKNCKELNNNSSLQYTNQTIKSPFIGAMEALPSKEVISNKEELISNKQKRRSSSNNNYSNYNNRESGETKDETIKDKTTATAATFQNVILKFERNIHRICPVEENLLEFWCNEMGDDLVNKAIDEAVMYDVKNIRYIDKILKSWNKSGVKQVIELKEYKNNWEHNRLKKKNNNGIAPWNGYVGEPDRYDFDAIEKNLLGWN
ncbi:DnaD domain-containing protein [Clostridium sp. DL1XJH146]